MSPPPAVHAPRFIEKQVNDLFVAQETKPSSVESLELDSLSAFQRTLLVIDGTVTKFIEAYLNEPIVIVRLGQKRQPLGEGSPWLEARKEAPVIVRQVLLQGAESHTPYAYAVSKILLDRLPTGIKAGLEIDGGGLGRLLLASQLENRRQMLWYGMERPAQLPEPLAHLAGEPFISRAYSVISGGKPIMVINEKFPYANTLL
jgi:chorismate-pyruvate lyase